jgi:SWI/SNF-related matrix-associated actin-dependent regulator of chromatin subfamily D
MKFNEIPQRLSALLYPPDPIVIRHLISKGEKKTTCYDIDVEVDDTLKAQMQSFLLSTSSQQEITNLDAKIHETVETINQLKVSREFFLGFAQGPQEFISKWVTSQNRDLKIITDVVGNPEEERRSMSLLLHEGAAETSRIGTSSWYTEYIGWQLELNTDENKHNLRVIYLDSA